MTPNPASAPIPAWNPDYIGVYRKRMDMLRKMRATELAKLGALEYYRTRPVEFINHWCDTVDPRNAGTDKPATMPLILFQRQIELVRFFEALRTAQANGLVEKSRDMGATWVACGYSVWLWIFYPDASVGWGSRKQEFVDKIGSMDSIFEKLRAIIRGLPREFWPKGFRPDIHFKMMHITNPENGASISGEIGDDIGRGGRKLIYFVDESAHLARPDLIEASLSLNTRIRIEISSVNGSGNVFHRKRQRGLVWYEGGQVAKNRSNVFIMDWAENPMHTQEWYDNMREEKESQGLLHVFEQEVNRNYSAAVEGIIIPAIWVKACIDAHLKIPGMETGPWAAALDPYDGGRDKHALVKRNGVVIKYADDWTEGDTGDATRKSVVECRRHVPIDIMFDASGVGAGVKSEANRLASAKDPEFGGEPAMPKGMRFIAWNGGSGVLDPDGPADVSLDDDEEKIGVSTTNADAFMNRKAQGYWRLRRRCEKTYRMIVKGENYPVDELISFDSKIPKILELVDQLSQPVRKKNSGSLKLVVDKTPDGSMSPNLADGTMMVMDPVDAGYVYDLAGML